jgi:hypothetical protein
VLTICFHNNEKWILILFDNQSGMNQIQGDCRKEPRRDPLCTKTKINQNS